MSDSETPPGNGYPNRLACDPRSVPELVTVALDAGDEEAWDAIGALHWRGTREVFDQAVKLGRSGCAATRARAADILGQLGIPDRAFPEESLPELVGLLADNDHSVIFSAIFALQHLDRERALPHVLAFRRHEDANVRYAVAAALGCLEHDAAIGALIELMGDCDTDVRDWATFGIGQQSDANTDAIREALAARLDDDDPDVRFEAACGLGRRRDPRAIPLLKTMLQSDPADPFAREAAARLLGLKDDTELGTPAMLAALTP